MNQHFSAEYRLISSKITNKNDSIEMLSFFLPNIQYRNFHQTPLMKLLVKLAFVAAVGGVGFEDVAVTGFQFFQDTALVYHSGSIVIGETA